MKFFRRAKKFPEDREGSTVIFFALSMVVIAGVAAFVIDVGNAFYMKRRLQSATDLASIAAASNMGIAQKAAQDTLAANGFPASALQLVEIGTYTANSSIPAAQRFTPASNGTGNAVRLTTQTTAPFIFANVLQILSPSPAHAQTVSGGGGGSQSASGITITAHATAATLPPAASFAVGSGLLSLNGGILNGVLGGLLGSNLSLSVMDYQSLASANIDLFAFSNALATRASLTAATYNQLISGTFSTGTLLGAVLDAAKANPSNGSAVITPLSEIAAAAPSAQVSPATLLSYGPYGSLIVGSTGPISVTVTALDLVSAIAQIANGTHQVQAGLNLNLAGLASASLELSIGERPVGTTWVAIGSTGASVHTAQTRLLLTVQLVATGQSSLVNVPIYVELASGTAQLNSIACTPSNMSASTVTLGVTPAVIDAWIGNVSNANFVNFSTAPNPSAATLLNVLGLATVTGLANAAITNLSATPVTFTYSQILQATRQTTSTTDFISSLLSSLIGNLQLTVNVLGLGLGLPTGLDQLVAQTLAAATSPIDQVLSQLLTTLGLGLGQAYTWVSGVNCGTVALVG